MGGGGGFEGGEGKNDDSQDECGHEGIIATSLGAGNSKLQMTNYK